MAKLKYGSFGQLEPAAIVVGTLTTATVLPAKSGRFLVWDISNAKWRAPASDEDALTGYCEDVIASSAASETRNIFTAISGKIFEVPFATAGAAAALTAAALALLIGKLVDIYVDGNGVQYANCSSTTDGLFRIVGGNPGSTAGTSTVFVEVVDAKVNQVS